MSSLFSNDSSLISNDVSTLTRKVCLRALFTVICLVSVILIIITRLKRPIKILLLNQIACDIIIMASSLTSAIYIHMDLDSSSKVCLVLVYLIIYGFVLGHASVAVISMNNYFAVTHPYKYKITFTTKNALLIILILWVGLAIICIGCVGRAFEPGLPCAPLINLPQYGMFIIFTLLFTFDLSVIIMNITLSVRLRRPRRVHMHPIPIKSVSGNESVQRRVGQQPTYPTMKELDQPSSSNALNSVEVTINTLESVPHSFHFIQRQRPKNRSTKIKSPPRHGTVYDSESQSLSSGNSDGSKVVRNITTNNMRVADRNTQKICQKDTKLGHKHPFRFIAGLNAYTKRKKHQEPSSISTDNTQQQMASILRRNNSSPNRVPSSNQEVAMNNNIRFRNLRVTMITIALWCSSLNLPFLVLLLYMSVIAEDRTHANYNMYRIIASSLMSFCAIGDPFIYAWRFVNWSLVFKWFKERCRCNGESPSTN